MTFHELLPVVHAPPRAEKLRLIELLAADVAREEGIKLGEAEVAHTVWPPHDAFDGAATLLRGLEEAKATS